MTLLLTTYDSALLNQIGSCVCQAIIAVQEQQPELLLEKYRNVQWRSSRHQSGLINKLTEVLSQTQDWDALVQQLQRFLKALLIPESLNSQILIEFLEKISQLNPAKPDLNGLAIPENLDTEKNLNLASSELNGEVCSNAQLPEKTPNDNAASLPPTGIAILLLDAENLQLNPESEKFLTTVCTCPIQVKIAFANWRSMGKLDVEFHGRGYELIHVPAGRDNADGKMIALGSSIHEHYPKAKEVLVCSSDTVMTNLCNHLQKNGLIVYRVSKQGHNITILNSHGETKTICISKPPSIQEFISQFKTIIKAEEARTANQWIKLSQIAEIYYNNYSFTLDEVVSHRHPGKTLKDVFINESQIVVHNLLQDTETYVALFKMPGQNKVDSNSSVQQKQLNTKADLEKVLVTMIGELASQTANKYIPLGDIGTKFNKQYGEAITKILAKLGLNCTFRTFLASECSSFQLQKTGDRWQAALR